MRNFAQCILAWEFVTRSCLKPQSPYSNHAIHVLFEHGFYLKRPKLGPICMHDVTLIISSMLSFAKKHCTRIYDVVAMLWRSKV